MNARTQITMDPELQRRAQAKAAERKDLDVGYNPIDPNNPSERVRTGVAIQVEGSRDPGEGA